MGVFGTGLFDNDDASDWILELSEEPDIELVRAAIDEVHEAAPNDYLDIDIGAVGLAASAILAGLLGGTRKSLPIKARVFCVLAKQLNQEPMARKEMLAQTALVVVKRVATAKYSEIAEALKSPASRRELKHLEKNLGLLAIRFGVGLAKRRPSGVPRTARFDSKENYWIDGPTDDAGRPHGAMTIFRLDGSLFQYCEFAHGKEHGAFTRFHESGEVSRQGECVRGKLSGHDVIHRATGPTSELLFNAAVSEDVTRMENEYENGICLSSRFFDARGNRVAYDGVRLPQIPKGVPESASYVPADETWNLGGFDLRGRPHGLHRSWNSRGRLKISLMYHHGRVR